VRLHLQDDGGEELGDALPELPDLENRNLCQRMDVEQVLEIFIRERRIGGPPAHAALLSMRRASAIR